MTKNGVEKEVFREAQRLWQPSASLIVAVSGGADSMALYALLRAINDDWPVRLYPVHIDHQLRENSSQEAQWLTRYFAEKFQTALRVCAITVLPRAGESLEMAARRQRYDALYSVFRELSMDGYIVTAHQKDDQAETVLMRFLQGTGIEGLQGMKSRRNRIVRPLLNVTRADLEQYLREHHLVWLNDPSNHDLAFLRNRLRHQVMPYLQDAVNPQLRDALAGLATRVKDYERAWDYLMQHWSGRHAVQETKDRLTLDAPWREWPPAVSIAYLRAFAQHHEIRVSAKHLTSALTGDVNWPRGWRVKHDERGVLEVFQEQEVGGSPLPINVSQEGRFIWGKWTIEVRRTVFAPPMAGIVINAARYRDLWIRSWQVGDRMRPLGLRGHSQKVQDIFVNHKVPRDQRRRWPLLLASGNGPILAVLGLRIAEDARAQRGDPVFHITVEPNPGNSMG